MSQQIQWRDPLPNAAATTFWGSLGTEDRRALDAAGEVRRLVRGTVLCRQGHEPGQVFLIYSGRVEVFRDDPTGHRIVLARRGPGDIIGELSAIDRGSMSATVNAIDPTTSLVIAASRFATLCQTRPRIAWLLLKNTVARLRDSDAHRSQYRADVRQRTIMCLLELAESDAQGSHIGQTISLRLTQQDLADMVSASLVSVTRALEELRRLGALSTGRGRILVDVDLLQALSSSQPW
ncbi:MAG: Crp/Fnr family transcriptional regulator [Pseudonocardiaceae bacterium]